MIETQLLVQEGTYPFDYPVGDAGRVSVEEMQRFDSLNSLRTKKAEMRTRGNIHCLVQLKHAFQDGLTMHFIYEHVPTSLNAYIKDLTKASVNSDITQMSKRLFLSNVARQIEILAAGLIQMSFNVPLNIKDMGIENDQLKYFLSSYVTPDPKISRKQLSEYYEHQKCTIQAAVELMFTPPRLNFANFVIKGNKLCFDKPVKTEADRVYSEADSAFNTTNNSQAFTQKPNYTVFENDFRKTQSPNYGKNLGLHESRRSARKHKGSFQFGNSRAPSELNHSLVDDDSRSYTHSKVTKIQLEKKIDGFKRERKNSYKLKITTCHEYDMNDPENPILSQKNSEADESLLNSEIFELANNRGDLFENSREPISPKCSGETRVGDGTQKQSIEEKIRYAKEKAQHVMNKYLSLKSKPRNSVAYN